MRRLLRFALVIGFVATLTSVSSCAGWDPEKPEREQEKVAETIAAFKKRDPGMKTFFNNAHGYAVFSTVGKGAMGIGGAYGKGRVYEKGRMIGTAQLTQVTYGFQLGGQAYSEIIFFQNPNAIDRFKSNRLEFSAQVSAVAVTAGASADAAYEHGVAVFTMAKGGLMYEAAIGGQTFTFHPNR